MENKNNKVSVNTEWCKGCGICITFCPKNILVLNDFDKVEVVDIDNCIGCRQCEYHCPDFAILVKENNG